MTPPDACGDQALRQQLVLIKGNDNPGAFGIDCLDPGLLAQGDPQTPSLPDGKPVKTLVQPQDFSLDRRRFLPSAPPPGNAVAGFPHKSAPSAMKQASWLSSRSAFGSPRRRAFSRTSVLVRAPRGKKRRRQLIVVEREKEIGLVLAPIQSAPQEGRSALVFLDARIMARGDFVSSQGPRRIEQKAEFDPFIADDARIGGAPAGIFQPAVAQHGIVKWPAAVEHVMGNAENTRDRSGLGRPGGAAAGAAISGILAGLELEGGADYFVAAFKQQRGRDARIHASAHGNKDSRPYEKSWPLSSAATCATISMTRSTSAAVFSGPREKRMQVRCLIIVATHCPKHIGRFAAFRLAGRSGRNRHAHQIEIHGEQLAIHSVNWCRRMTIEIDPFHILPEVKVAAGLCSATRRRLLRPQSSSPL